MMSLTQDPNASKYMVRAYTPGQLQINEQTLTQSVIIAPTQLSLTWPPQTFADLAPEHLQLLLNFTPEIVLIGTGSAMHFLSPEWSMLFYAQKIGVECMPTAAACRTFNVLAAEERNVVAGLMVY